MEPLVINFNTDMLYNRCYTDILNRGQRMEQKPEMCEHDRQWFDVCLEKCADIADAELRRISKGIDDSVVFGEDALTFTVKPTSHSQRRMLPAAIENFIASYIIDAWFMERLGVSAVDISQALSYLKHITLMSDNVIRKPYF